MVQWNSLLFVLTPSRFLHFRRTEVKQYTLSGSGGIKIASIVESVTFSHMENLEIDIRHVSKRV
jgi:hypothetical protein